MKSKLVFKTLFNVAVTLIIIFIFGYLCLSENGLAELVKNKKNFNIFWLIIAIACEILNMSVDVYLVYQFTHNHDKKYTVTKAIKSTMVGQFFSAVTPGSSGGQPMQIYVMSKQNVNTGIATSALIQKFLVFQTVLTFYSAIAIILRFDYFNGALGKFMKTLSLLGFSVQAIIILTLLLFSFNKKITRNVLIFIFNILARIKLIKEPNTKITKLETQLELFHKSNIDLHKNKTLVFKTYIFTAVQLIAMFLIPYCVYRSFNFHGASIINMLCSEAFTTMVSYFTPLPGAAGMTEFASAIFFSNFFTKQTIKSAILVKRLLSYYFLILVAAPFAHLAKDKSKPNEPPQEPD